MSEITDTLSHNPFFQGLTSEQLAVLADNARYENHAAHALIFAHDTPANAFYVITKGSVRVEIPSLYGAPLVVQNLRAGEVLGWSWLIPPYKCHFDARAMTETTVLSIDGSRVLSRCEQDPQLGYELFKRFAGLMSERLTQARVQIIETCAPPEMA